MFEQRIEIRVARETAKATAQLKAELELARGNLETLEKIAESQAAQLEARQAQNKALDDQIAALGGLLENCQEYANTWKKRKLDMDEKVKTSLEEIVTTRQKSAEAAKQAFDKGYAEGSESAMSWL